MSKTKLIIPLLSLALILTPITACESSSTPHKHSFSEWSTISSASCTEDGE